VCVCVCVCARARARACVSTCVVTIVYMVWHVEVMIGTVNHIK
jgi:hypothetical protein